MQRHRIVAAISGGNFSRVPGCGKSSGSPAFLPTVRCEEVEAPYHEWLGVKYAFILQHLDTLATASGEKCALSYYAGPK